MREIKFRAWDKTRKEMISWKNIDRFNAEGLMHLVDLLMGNELDFIPLQYTGLKDRNGADIYEGDIIKTEYGATGVVKYDPPCFDFECSEPFWSHTVYGMGGEKEIIGNIYKNPEMVKS